ncbi:MAG: hypothetical protein IJ632_08235 [Muribaculaceae bacterium]|nr:hypothetical protein [Muribaculaceae bacterium]
MKKIVLTLMVALMATAMMNAQGHRHHGGQREMRSPEKMIEMRVERLDKALNLTAEQKRAITDLYKQEFEARKAQGEMNKDSKKERPSKEQMKAQRDATDAQVEKLLTGEQQAKFAQFKQEEAKHMKGGHGPKHHGAKGGQDGGCCAKDKKADGDCCKKAE